jgi:spore maturation protein CgeB
VAVLCTESPYDCDQELERVAVVDAAWTHERLAVPTLHAVNPHVRYLPHAWNPSRHGLAKPDPTVPAHDVVFVGSGFSERVEWFNAINWTGIDLGLYGLWDGLGLDEHLEQYVKQWITPNDQAVALYRRATIGLNLYRSQVGYRAMIPRPAVVADSLNPRAYELAACAVFQISSPRAEVTERFGDSVPTITGKRAFAKQDEAVIREWLQPERAVERVWRADASRRCVEHETWVVRAAQVVADIHTWNKVAA